MPQDNNDISLKELFTRIGEYCNYILKSYKSILLIAILSALTFFGLKFNTKAVYSAELTFMLNEDTQGNLGGLGGILGQFGLGMSSQESNLDKILQLSKARRITQNALFNTIEIGSKSTYLANHLISVLEKDKRWTKSGLLSFSKSDDSLDLEGFMFVHDSLETFTLLENKALKRLHLLLAGNQNVNGLFSSEYSELTGIMKLHMNSHNEDLSVATVNLMFEELSKYYIEKATEKQEYDFNIIKNKHDSISNRLAEIQYQIAVFQDSHRNIFRKQDILKEKQLKTEEQKLLIMTGEVEKQYQIASLALDNKTPYIQLIDMPLKPIRPSNQSRFYYLILGGLLGGLITISYHLLRKMITDIMNS